ncbi:MAG: hypothetical protein ABEH88_10370 [Halobacteriales archaeon]|jgi:hypothetical protein
MGLQDLNGEIESAYSDLDEEMTVELGREARHELAMLIAALDEEGEDLVERAVHLLFQTSIDTAKLDFHLRGEYDVTYDEYLSGMTYEDMTGGEAFSAPDEDDRRYQI